MKNCIILLIFILLVNTAFICRAQQNDTLDLQRTYTGKVNFARFKPNSARKMQSDTLFLKSILKMKNDDSYRCILESNDALGFTHKKFQQYYKGIKVENSMFMIHGKNGMIETINGDFQIVEIYSISPSITELKALDKALAFVKSKKYKWEEEAYEKFIKQRENNPAATYYPKGELVIAKDYLKGGNNFLLAWKFTISSLEPDNEQLIYVDAVSGEVIGNTALILDANTVGSAQTIYSQTQSIICDSYFAGAQFRLSENRNTTPGHSTNIHTWNCLNASNYTNKAEFSNTNTNWITGSWSAIGQDQAALDAHWGEERILDYWSTVHQRNSLNDQGIDVIGYVHFYDATQPLIWPNNAQWDGFNNVMRYGNGDGLTFNPLTALDVVAHEMGHGINQFTAYLHSATGNQECDALNEGFSDIWGACIEHWAAPNKQMWTIGEEIFKTTTYTCIRNLQDPMSNTAYEHPHPNTYHGTFWSNDGEPHINSTVLSHWYYLLSIGGTGWNNGQTSQAPINTGYQWSVNPIGIDAAQKIAYRAESHYLTPTDNYMAARNATINAAIDLYAVNSCQVKAVTDAWYAVGVGGAFQYTNVSVSSPATVCSSGATFTVNNVPPGCSVTWNCSANLTFDDQPGNPKVFTAIGTGPGTITATINNGNCGSVTLPAKNIWVGAPAFTGTVTGPTQLTPGYYATYSVPLAQGVTTYNWTIPSGCYNTYCWRIVSGQGTRSIYVQSGAVGNGSIQCTAYNSCGTDSRYIPITVQNPGDPCPPATLSLTPNPSTDGNVEIDVIKPPCDPTLTAMASAVTTTATAPATATVTVTNSMGTILYIGKHSGKKAQIKGLRLKPGMYHVVYISSNTKLDGTMIVE